MAPVYVVGLDRSDPWYKQTAYSLESPHLVNATAGDPLRPVVHITNNRKEPLSCRIGLILPDGWEATSPATTADVAPGEARAVELPFTIAFSEKVGSRDATIVISEGGEIKRMGLKVLRPACADGAGEPDGGRTGQDIGDGHGR